MTTCPNPRCGQELAEGFRFCPHCATEVDPQPVTERLRVVTVLFHDLVSSTRLTELLSYAAMQRLLNDYRDLVHDIAAKYGGEAGTVDGDGGMVAFGVGTLNDDDALRAARAALDLRERVHALGQDLSRDAEDVRLAIRIGINSGPALVTSAGPIQQRVNGLTVIIAKRLEEHAEPNQILLGERTHHLVSKVARTGRLDEPLRLKGVSTLARAWRLEDVATSTPHPSDGPMMGRDRDLTLLLHLLERTIHQKRLQLVTVYGPPGVGKSRLVREFERHAGVRAAVLHGECLAYGESITFWPIAQIIQQAAGIDSADKPETAKAKLRAVVADEAEADRITDELAQLLGQEGGDTTPGAPHWALRQFLKRLGRRQTTVVVLDNLQFAQPGLLDAVEDVTRSLQDTQVFLLCMARPDELLAVRKDWPGGQRNACSMALVPLQDSDSDNLIRRLLDDQQVDQAVLQYVTVHADGNPLFIEEIIRMLKARDGLRLENGVWTARNAGVLTTKVPDTIHPLLQARLDRLPTGDRLVLEQAAIVGELFHAADLRALDPERDPDALDAALQRLCNQEFVLPDPGTALPLAGGGEAFRFRHILLRDVAYRGMTAGRLGRLHEDYANYVERTAVGQLGQIDELIGSHLAIAHKRLHEHDAEDEDDSLPELARRAGERQLAAASRTRGRGDTRGATALLAEVVALLADGHPAKIGALLEYADLLCESNPRRADGVYRDVLRLTVPGDDPESAPVPPDADIHSVAHARLGLLEAQLVTEPGNAFRQGRPKVEAVLGLLRGHGDPVGFAKAWRLLAYLNFAQGRSGDAHEAAEQALKYANEADDTQLQAQVYNLDAVVLLWGPTHLDEVKARLGEMLTWSRGQGRPDVEATVLGVRARAAAMQHEFDAAREDNRKAEHAWSSYQQSAAPRSRQRNLNTRSAEPLTSGAHALSRGLVEYLADDLFEAERVLRHGRTTLEGQGNTASLASVSALLARVLLRKGQLDAATEIARECERIVSAEQKDTHVRWRSILAVTLALQGKQRGDAAALGRAVELAREAVSMAEATQQPDTEAEAQFDLAEVSLASGDQVVARRSAYRAKDLYEEKGNVVAAGRVHWFLRQLGR